MKEFNIRTIKKHYAYLIENKYIEPLTIEELEKCILNLKNK